tara:strand:+ start:525 stop:809 length:285 start_codon:yes stop_codon:yes gene_type:complete
LRRGRNVPPFTEDFMKIKITTDRKPFLNDEPQIIGNVVEVTEEEAATFIENGFAEEVKTTSKPKRARNADGTLKGDDKSTPGVNEAWEGGEAPE